MFLLEALLSCVASPFVNVAGLGPNQHPQCPVPDPPTAQNYHDPTILASRVTTVMSGMARTRSSDLGVWLVLSWQRAVLSRVECVCPAKGATLKNVRRGCLGTLACPFKSDGWSLKTTFPWQQTVSLLHLKRHEAENKQKVQCLTPSIRFDFTGLCFCVSAVPSSKQTSIEPLLFVRALISQFSSPKTKTSNSSRNLK